MSENENPNEHQSTALKVYFDATQTIRHYDGERTATHRLAVAALGGLFAFSGTDLFNQPMLPILSLVGVLLSLLFLAITFKHSALISRERGRAGAARDLLSKLGDHTISNIDAKRNEQYRTVALSRTRIASLWSLMYVMFALSFGAFLYIHAAPYQN